MKFKVYRLCRDNKRIKELREQEKKYSLPESIYMSGIDLYSFVNKIIHDCEDDYALLCHDDVILPQNIEKNVNNCISSANEYLGLNNWGVIGNAGLEIISKKTTTFLADPHTKILSYSTKNPIIVESVDGNTMLLNIKALREKNINLPKELSGYHLYDVILCMEAYKNGLVCGISSWLYVKHLSKGNYDTFKEAIKEEQYQAYFRISFSNHVITTINDLIEIKRDYKHLENSELKLNSYENTINNVVSGLFKSKRITLNILIRLHKESKKFIRLLDYINILQEKIDNNITLNVLIGVNNITKKEIGNYIEDIKKDFPFLNITEIYVENTDEQYPRVHALKRMVEKVYKDENSYVWIVDYDDFIMPEIAQYLQYILYNEDVVIGNSQVFTEKWNNGSDIPAKSTLDHVITIDNVKRLLHGSIFLPICSVIYRAEILEDIFKNNDLVGDYFEDYAITLLALKDHNYKCVPISFAGISYHGSNTVVEEDRTHWNYSYTSFLSEILNKGLFKKLYYENMSAMNTADYLEFEGFKKGLIWRSLQKYRKIKNKLINIFLTK